jgi:hypothetical protein
MRRDRIIDVRAYVVGGGGGGGDYHDRTKGDNVWGLHGLVECLERRGETKDLEGFQRKLATTLAKTDMVVSSSSLCRTSVIFQRQTH